MPRAIPALTSSRTAGPGALGLETTELANSRPCLLVPIKVR
jgi:hypothetical protein